MARDIEVSLIPLKDIKPYARNAKKHGKEQVTRIAESIKRFGFTVPILIDKDNIVIAGHGRALAAKRLGIAKVPVIQKDEWTEEEVRAYRLADNKVAESGYDKDLILEELAFLDAAKIDMEVFGFGLPKEDDEPVREKEVKFTAKEKHQVVVECSTEKETYIAQKAIEALGYRCTVKNT